MDKKTKDISTFIALVLRHKPDAAGITLDEHGWADANALVNGINREMGTSINMAFLEEIVRTDKKQRYSFNDDHTLIRANQGHSIPVDVELEEKTPPDILWHGTGMKYFRSIEEQGLLPKSRLYVCTYTFRQIAKLPLRLEKDTAAPCSTASRVGKWLKMDINSIFQKTEYGLPKKYRRNIYTLRRLGEWPPLTEEP